MKKEKKLISILEIIITIIVYFSLLIIPICCSMYFIKNSILSETGQILSVISSALWMVIVVKIIFPYYFKLRTGTALERDY